MSDVTYDLGITPEMVREQDQRTILAGMSEPGRRATFLSRLRPEGDCLLWTMAINGSGYGVFRIGADGISYTCMAHRVAWMLHHDSVIPPDLQIDHTCRVRACCNPDHLEVVDRRENIARSTGRSLATDAPVARRGPSSIHPRRRAGGVRYQLVWREYLEDGSVVQRGTMHDTLEDAEKARAC